MKISNRPIRRGRVTEPIELENNPDSVNPSWEQLYGFLIEDTTEDKTYIEDEFVCADFATLLHNNAEVAGIRAAVVIIHIEGEENPHALNAFVTTDRRLVFIDDTGLGEGSYINMGMDLGYGRFLPSLSGKNLDKICYINKDKEYSILALDGLDIPNNYEEYLNKKDLIIKHNQKASEYIKIHGLYTCEDKLPKTGKQWTEKQWEEFLKCLDEAKEYRLIPIFEMEGIVTKIEIYW